MSNHRNADGWNIVIVESPFAPDKEQEAARKCVGETDESAYYWRQDQMAANGKYLKRACLDCLSRHEVPYASHGFFPHFLDETNPEQRELGLTAGYAMWTCTNKVVFYVDRGFSPGMQRAFERATAMGYVTEQRFLDKREDS